MIAVSHDRYFLDRVTRHLFAIEDRKAVPYIGGYESYLDAQDEKAGILPAAKPAAEKPAAPAEKKQNDYSLRFTFKEQRDFDTIDDTLQQLEEKIGALDKEIEKNSSNYARVMELMEEQSKARAQLDEATERWLYLQDKWEKIQAAKG